VADGSQIVGRLIYCHPAQIAFGAIGELAGHGKLQFVRRRKEYFLRWFDREAGQLRRAFEIVLKSATNPTMENLIFGGIGLESLAAFVGHFSRGLEQNQASLWFERIGPTSESATTKNIIIKSRVFAAQGELEARFAVLISVTTSGIAACLRQHWHYLVTKGDSSFHAWNE
jgi:hypothetical protein